LGRGVGLGDPQRALPTPAMLGFCENGYLVKEGNVVPYIGN